MDNVVGEIIKTDNLVPSPLVFYPKKTKLVLLAIGGVVMTAGSLFIVKVYPGDPFVFLIGIFGALFFGLCLVYIVYRLFSPKPSLILDKDGFVDQSSPISIGRMSWSEVKDMFVYELERQKHLGVEPHDINGILAKATGIKRKIMEVNLKLTQRAPVNISQAMIPIPIDELFVKMKQYWEVAKQISNPVRVV